MPRPTDPPDWATDADYPAGSEDWSGQPTRTEPSSGEKGTGFIPQDELPADYLNWLFQNHADWINYLDAAVASHLGDGSDGDIHLENGGSAPSGITANSATEFTLDRHIYATEFTLDSGLILHLNGFALFAIESCILDGDCEIDGETPTDENGGAGGAANQLGGGSSGGAGGIGPDVPGNDGDDLSNALGGIGGDGGKGAVGNNPGVGGYATPPVASMSGYRSIISALTGHVIGGGSLAVLAGGCGGGGGGGKSLGASGGGGGGGGGVALVAARELGGTGSITALGGNGAPGTGTGNAGGGGGGGGGVIYMVYGYITGTIHGIAAAGDGGAALGTGDAGLDGFAGQIIAYKLVP